MTCRHGFVYVLVMLGPEPVFKIGKAKSITRRILQIQPALPYETVLAFVFWSDDALEFESTLHRSYATHRVMGEWFALPDRAFPQLIALSSLTSWSAPAWAHQHVMEVRKSLGIHDQNVFRDHHLDVDYIVQRWRRKQEAA